MVKNNTTTNVSYEFTYNIIPLAIMSAIGAASNVLFLVAFIKDPLKCFRNSGTYLVINLSVSDCLTCSIDPLYLVKDEILNSNSPSITEILTYWFAVTSFLSITSISIDRFLLVAYPIKHRILMKGKLIVLWLATIWIVGCVVAVLSVIHIRTNGGDIIQIFSATVILLSSVMHSSTYYKLKKQSRNIALQNPSDSRAQEIRIAKERRFLQTIILVACIAFGYYLSSDSLNFPKDKLTSEVIGTTLFIFYINFAVNPFIYILRLPNYRKTFYLIYCKRRTVSS